MTDDSQQAPPANPIGEQDPMDAPPPQRPEDESEAPEDVTPGRVSSFRAAVGYASAFLR